MSKNDAAMHAYDTPFIGRENELKQIDSVVNAWGKSRLICLDGSGGIGKTRLLAETYFRYSDSAPQNLEVLGIIDFDDSSFQIPGKIEQHIAESLDDNVFDAYWNAFEDFQRIEKANVSQVTLENHKEITQRAFLDGLKNFTTKKRLLLLFDTAEKQNSEEIWKIILTIMTETPNLFMLIAGRNANSVWDKFRKRLGNTIQVNFLTPLDTEASGQYLAAKQKKLRMNIAPEIVDGLLFLAQGHPIFLDLAVEWVARDLPKEWISEITRNKLATGDLNSRRQEFERLLVNRVMEIRTPMDRLCLMLSRIYPLNPQGIAELLKMSPENAQELFENALTYVFIKRLPGERISLHDEMRRMILAYVWTEIDKSNERRIHESKLIVSYLKKKIAENTNILTLLESPHALPENGDNAQRLRSNLLEISAREQETWILQGQYIEHLRYYDPQKALGEFVAMFDREQRNNPKEILVQAMLPGLKSIPESDRYDFVERQIKILYNIGNLEQVITIGNSIDKSSITPEYQMDLLNKLARAKMALGKIPEALQDLNESLQICQSDPNANRWISGVYSLLGLAHRQMGQYSGATKYYEFALKSTTDEKQTASVLNNFGYVLALQGKYRSAITYCLKGLAIREKNNLKTEIGASLSTMGEIYRNWGKYKEALEYYNRALAIFEPEKSIRWLARIYSFRGALYRLIDDYELAEQDLKESVRINIPAEKPWAYHVLGCVYWDKNDLQQALKYFQTSDQLAEETHDMRSRVNNLVFSAEIYFTQWRDQKDPELIAKIQESEQNLRQILQQKYDFPHHLGRLLRILGDIAFEQKDYKQAKHFYAEAYAALGKRTGGYGKQTFFDEIENIAQKIQQLSQENVEEAYQWCEYFMSYWSDETREIMRRDDLISMCNVQKIEIDIQKK